jgi:serine/threonine protein phosphatase PrpC
MPIANVNVDVFGMTDTGKVRKVNEDQFLVASMHKVMEIEQTSLPKQAREHLDSGAMARLFLVADGVGGSAAGEEASGLAVETVAGYVTNSMRCFYQLDKQMEDDLMSELESSVQKSHAMVQSAAAKAPDYAGMATTLTVVHVLWPTVYIVQVGDSRCYRLRDGVLTQLTKDQTMAQHLIEEGVLTPENADQSRWSHMLSSAVGKEIAPATSKDELQAGDSLVLCTDGLTKHVSNEGIVRHVSSAESAQDACERLVSAALEDGGSDNVTVVVSIFS